MKSDKKKWSDKDMDEILTSFFQAEVPSRLDGPLRLTTPAVRSRVPAAGGARVSSNWMKVAVASCVAALVLATVAFQFGSTPGSSESSGAGAGVFAVQPGDADNDQPINVRAGVQDDSDISVPEQDIELVD